MSFTYEDKKIDSIFIDKIWHVKTTASGIYTADIDSNWDIIISRANKSVSVMVNGVGKKAAQVPYVADIESIGIALKPGVFLRNLKGKDIVDSQHVLLHGNDAYIEIDSERFKIPTNFTTAEAFIDKLASKGILRINPVAISLGKEDGLRTSDRSMRRHVAQTTGLSPYFFHQIQRAQQAVQLLQQGMSVAQTAAEVGYTDQAHMTKAVKQLIGKTPAQIAAKRHK